MSPRSVKGPSIIMSSAFQNIFKVSRERENPTKKIRVASASCPRSIKKIRTASALLNPSSLSFARNEVV